MDAIPHTIDDLPAPWDAIPHTIECFKVNYYRHQKNFKISLNMELI